MEQKNQDMTSGSLAKGILFFSIPLMLSNILQVLFNMSDIAVVGHFAGAMALGSVGSTTILVTMFTGFLIGLSGGINVLVALYYGAKNERGVKETVHSAAILSLIIGVILLLIGAGFSRNILELLNTKEELLDGAVLYIRLYFLGLPALALYNFGNAVFSAVGIFRLQMKDMKLTKGKARDIVRIGIPAGCQNMIFAIANLFVQVGVNSFSATMVAGNSAAANSDALIYDMMAAFYTGCASFMGQNYGAGKKERILKSYFVSLAYSFGVGAIMGLMLVIFG